MEAYINKPEETNVTYRYSEAHNRATKKYQNKVYDNIRLRVPKGYREKVMHVAIEASGLSMNDYILSAIHEKMVRDGFDLPDAKTWKENNGAQ